MGTNFWPVMQASIDYLKAVAEVAGDDPAKVDDMTPAAVFDAVAVSKRNARVEAIMRALHGALADVADFTCDVGGLQACSVDGPEGDDGLPTELHRTLIDGYFDLRRVAEILVDAFRTNPELSP